MKKNAKNWFSIIFLLLVFFGCSPVTDDKNEIYSKFEIKTLSAEQLAKILYSNDSSIIFIDIRNPHQFKNGHLPNAINIPAKFAEKYADIWSNDQMKIIYGNDASDAVLLGYWLSYNNYKNVFVALGGYDFIKNNILENYAIYSGIYDDEKPLFNYKEFIAEISANSGSTENENTTPAPTIQVPVNQSNDSEPSGGCE